VSAPSAPYQGAADNRGGLRTLYGLYELTVSHPTPKTWYLAGVNLEPDFLYAGSPAYEGLVLAEGDVAAAGVLDGVSQGGSVSLVLSDHLGSYRDKGPFRRWSDQFAEPAPGYAVPYDLDTAVLVVKSAWSALGSGDARTHGRFVVVPGSKRLASGERAELRLDFESDPRFHRPLPRRKVTRVLHPNAPDSSIGRSIPIPIGAGVTLPGILVDPALGRYVFSESPVATSVGTLLVRKLFNLDFIGLSVYDTIVPNASPSTPIIEDDTTGTGGAFILLDPSDVDVDTIITIDMGTLIVLNEGRLVDKIAFPLRADRAGGGFNLAGSVTAAIHHNINGQPAGTPIHADASATIDFSTLTSTLTWYNFVFPRPVFLQAAVPYWLVLSAAHAKSAADAAGCFVISNFLITGGTAGRALRRYNRDAFWHASPGNDDRHSHRVYAINFAVETTLDDGSGHTVTAVTFGQDMGDDLAIVGLMNGVRDDGSGTYTGTPSALIQNGADVLHWLERAPIAMGLDAALVDTAALATLRGQLANWFDLAGVVNDEQDAMIWLQRVARCCRAAVFENHDGKLSVVGDGPGPSPSTVRDVKYWEHGPLTCSGQPEALGQPWTLVEVYAGRRFVEQDVSTRVATLSGTREIEWGVLLRHEASADLIARYGIRSNGGAVEAPERFLGGGPAELNTFHFVPSAAAAQEVLDWLVAIGAKVLDPWSIVAVPLPRFALSWSVMDEITLESHAFPSALDRALVGQVHWSGAVWDGGTTQWYQCRRGRFSVRALGISLAHGPELPVQATLKLVAWETP
jgi:hypothetical protein